MARGQAADKRLDLVHRGSRLRREPLETRDRAIPDSLRAVLSSKKNNDCSQSIWLPSSQLNMNHVSDLYILGCARLKRNVKMSTFFANSFCQIVQNEASLDIIASIKHCRIRKLNFAYVLSLANHIRVWFVCSFVPRHLLAINILLSQVLLAIL